jgi:preprotein translocase subunit Sec61beta
MSRKKQRKDAPMPATSAGLLRFYEEKTDTFIKIRPEFVIIITATLIVSIILAHIFIS